MTEVNSALEDEPSIINESPLEKGWIVKVQFDEEFGGKGLMDPEAYEKFLETCEKHH